jgi:hypothetical protein
MLAFLPISAFEQTLTVSVIAAPFKTNHELIRLKNLRLTAKNLKL